MSIWKVTEWIYTFNSLVLDYIFKGSQVHSASLGNSSNRKNVARILSLQYKNDFSAKAIRIWRLFFKSASLMQVVEQNKTTVSIFKFWNANFWYSNSSVFKHMIKRPRGKCLHCCVCFYSFKHCGFMQEEIHFWDGTTGEIRWNRMWKIFQVLTCQQYEMNHILKMSSIQFRLLIVFLKSYMKRKQRSHK